MTAREKHIIQEALELPPLARAALIDQLFRSFDAEPGETSEIEAAWATEARDRMTAYAAGEISARPGDDVFDDLDRKFGV